MKNIFFEFRYSTSLIHCASIAFYATAFIGIGNAQATLLDRGGGLIYDDALNITWLQDANYAKTSGYDLDGRMTWGQATEWASNLEYGGYSDWRLPIVAPVNGVAFDFTNWDSNGLHDLGYNITSTSSEMSYLFYVDLGNKGYLSPSNIEQLNYGLVNTTPFINFMSGQYWSDTTHSGDTGNAWGFDTSYGAQNAPNKANLGFALAVRDGDISSPVPEPEAYAMLLAGLGLLRLTARHRKQSA